MACTHPRIMAVCDISKISWPYVKRLEELNWKINFDRGLAYRLVAKDSRDHLLEEIPSWSRLEDIEIPCGHCIQCRLDYSKTWAIRCCHEASMYHYNYFVTLTIDDKHLEYGQTGNPTLNRKVFTRFINTLRKKFSRLGHVGVRFFGCGEYGNGDGSRGLNPHYHVILFNCPLTDLSLDFICDDGTIVRKKSSCGEPLYFSQFIKDCWPYGFITVEDANYRTEAYVSRYILKKQGTSESLVFNKNLGVLPPFLGMSNRPAIGNAYFEDNEEFLIDNPSLIVPRDRKEPLVSGLPRFYKKKIFERHPELYDSMLSKAKDNILKARSLLKNKICINDQRASKEEHVLKSFQAYDRNL